MDFGLSHLLRRLARANRDYASFRLAEFVKQSPANLRKGNSSSCQLSLRLLVQTRRMRIGYRADARRVVSSQKPKMRIWFHRPLRVKSASTMSTCVAFGFVV